MTSLLAARGALGSLRRAPWLRTLATWRWLAMDVVRIRRRLRAQRGPDDFDRALGVRTQVAPPLREFWRTARRGGFEHEPTSPGWFRELLDGLDVDVKATVFVDYGSGAGRAVLLAAEYPFKAVVGVELSPSLHALAEANLRARPASARRAGAVQLVCGDAAGYELPPDPLVLYFYNPFGAAVMRRVLAQVERALARRPRPVTLVLAHCYRAPREVVEQHPRFRTVRAEAGFLILRAV